ncbi:MAG: hypothetical protein QM813_01265 [Verrucomicrobiota bacterium]
MKPKLFNELLASVRQAQAIERGKMKPARVTMTPAKARALIRSGRGLPQATAKDEAEVQEAIKIVRRRKG